MAIQTVTIRVDQKRRIILYPDGGVDLEFYEEGPGWILDNAATVSDAILGGYLADTLSILKNAAEHFGVEV